MPATLPTTDQLTDLFTNCSVALFVTDDAGTVLLRNKAADVLSRSGAGTGSSVLDEIRPERPWADLVAAAEADGIVQHVAFDVLAPGDAGASAFANLSTSTVDGERYVHVVLRPVLEKFLPVSEGSSAHGPSTDARTWISQVDDQAVPSNVLDEDSRAALLRAFFTDAPVAIHMIATDGSVAFANHRDIALTAHDTDVDGYLGHHIRQIYADKNLVEDFMGRWDEDSPIINFRANFVRKDGDVEPVLIFSTANAQDGLQNTRCFVFRDPTPSVPRDQVGQFG